MKLVDILAKEMAEWPFAEKALGQACDGSLHSEPFNGGHTKEKYTMASRYGSEIVYRRKWQAAVDALKVGEQQSWNGEGLPPIGTVYEVAINKVVGRWQECTVVGHDSDLAVYRYHNGEYNSYGAFKPGSPNFRPVRTAEQIAAEERKAAITEMTAGYKHMSLNGWAEYVYDTLGYRKQVQP